MALGGDRYASRADTLVFLGCLALSFGAMGLPDAVRDPVARVLRQTVLAPFLVLQQASEELRTSRTRFEAVTAQRDSAALAASFLPELRRENERLRGLLGLGQRLVWGHVAAEVLHQAEATDPLTLVVSAGREQGVRSLAGVVSPEGLVGLVRAVDARTSIVLTWAHPDFRASAMAADGSVFGIVAPHGALAPGVWLLELRGVPYRQVVADGTVILTSGLGGVYPRGIPLGTIVGVAGEAEGWARTYLVRPAVHPSAVSHVMILTAGRGGDVRDAFRPAGR
ncbi:MAG: rod shape-determining protein MreC [Gemmatimonadales bacterium]